MRHLLEIDDLSPDELLDVLDRAERVRSAAGARPGRGMALIFEKPSARTRNSMEMAVVPLGGHPVTIRGDEVGARRARERRGRHPHAGLLPRRHRGSGVRARQGRAHGRASTACPWSTCCPTRPTRCRRWPTCSRSVSTSGRSRAGRSPTSATATTSADRWSWPRAWWAWRCGWPPRRASGCPTRDVDRIRAGRASSRELTDRADDAVAGRRRRSTPTCGRRWARRPRPSARRRAFEGFTVDDRLHGARPRPKAVFLHCLPAHRGEEVAGGRWSTAPAAVIWAQAANRMHAARGPAAAGCSSRQPSTAPTASSASRSAST